MVVLMADNNRKSQRAGIKKYRPATDWLSARHD